MEDSSVLMFHAAIKQKTRLSAGFKVCSKEVPPTGLEPVRSRDQQILSLQRLPFRHEGL